MGVALDLARHSLLLSDPNPRVGCVLVAADGETVLGQGFTQQVGGPHAEVMALRDAAANGADLRGATAYVTLEPCSHFGRTPPCADALVAAGLAQVFVGAIDPNPRVAGRGIARLQAAGIVVETGILAAECQELNIGFFSRMQRQRPWVRAKVATSLDGRTALTDGTSQWITCPEARADGHAWRARASALLTGIGTVLADDPQLNVRTLATPRQPWHVILDTHLRTPTTARILHGEHPVVIYTTQSDAARQDLLTQAGASICVAPQEDGEIDLLWVLQDLARRECNELHVEAGGTLTSALLRAGLVDELLVYLAPKLIGPGLPLYTSAPMSQLSDALEFKFQECTPVGTDLRLLARRTSATMPACSQASSAA